MAIDRLPIALTIADASRPDCPLIAANERFQKITGYAPAAVIGQNCRFLQVGCEGSENDAARDAIRAAISHARGIEVVLRNRTREGEPFDNFLIMHTVTLGHGRSPAIVGSQFRISGRTTDAEVTEQANQVRDTLSRLNFQRNKLRDERYRSLARSSVELVRTWNYRRSGQCG
ncbi:MAG: PAS domain-containing protein [Marinobacter sp.]